ncbi:MAG: hemerythrin domain-containing protein [Acidimicrobiales bacterium]|nr:hemerythrin domain-containing protein [Acidimicrobiales bacterium]MBO0886380.1 hemerythrin domain-containing protein [Acidimicrobiales bacterium]
MATRERVLAALRESDDYLQAAASLGIPPGQAYLIATGLPADGSGGLAPEDRSREGFLPDSNRLLYGAPDGPARSRTTMSFVLDRVEADRPMREAAERRNALPAPPEEDDEATTEVTTVLGRDHSRVKALLEQLEAIPGRSRGGTERHVSRRASILDLITVELSGHEALEEQYLWPVVRRALPSGDEAAELALTQEQEGKDTLSLLGKLGGQSADFDPLVERLALLLRRHVAHEDRVFLELRARMSEPERESLGLRIASGKPKAPTRPHPHAPSSPGALKVAGAGAAALDRARDALGSRPAERLGRAEGEGPEGDPTRTGADPSEEEGGHS